MKAEAPFQDVSTVLVVISSLAQSFDSAALRNFITHAYPHSAVFFITTSGDAVGSKAPSKVDLVIDFTPPKARQGFFFARSMRKAAKYAVGRAAGWYYRKSKYDRVYDEAKDAFHDETPKDYLAREAWVQRRVLELAGVHLVRQGGVGQDRSKDIALELPRV